MPLNGTTEDEDGNSPLLKRSREKLRVGMRCCASASGNATWARSTASLPNHISTKTSRSQFQGIGKVRTTQDIPRLPSREFSEGVPKEILENR